MNDATRGEDARLDALRRADVLDTPPEPSFDRLTGLAARFLGVPVALVSFVDRDRQFFKSGLGLPEAWARRRETPLSHSFCRHVVEAREPLVIEDAREHPLVRDNAAIADLGVVAYLGVPLTTADGHVLGSLCAIDGRPRAWSADDVATLVDLAHSVMAEVALRQEIAERARAERWNRLMMDNIRDHAIFSTDPDGVVNGWEAGATRVLGYTREEVLGRDDSLFFTPEDREAGIPGRERHKAATDGRAEDTRWHVRKGGQPFFVTGVVNAMRDEAGALVGFAKVMRDVTSRKHLEEQARSLLDREREARGEAQDAQRRYRDLIDALPQLVWTCGPDGSCDHLSRQWVEYTGMPEADQLGMGWLDRAIHPEDRDRTAAAWEAAIQGRSDYDLEYRLRGGDGAYRWFKTRGVPWKDARGRVVKWFGTCTDIEDQKRASEALRDARERLQSALDAGAIATWAWDIPGDRVYADANLTRLFGVSPQDASGGPISAYLAAVHPEDRADLSGAIGEAVATGGHFDEEYRVLRPDGSTLWVVARGHVRLGDDGGPRSLSGVIVDVTERRRGEEERLRLGDRLESQARIFDTVLSNTPDLMYVFDLAGRFTYANHALLSLWGRTWDEAIGKSCLELGYEPWHAALHEREVAQVIATRRPIRGEVPFEGTNGRRIYDYIFVPVLNAQGEVEAVAGSTRDVTDRKRSEEEVARLHESERQARLLAEAVQAEVEAAGRAKDRFLAMLSHELRTPINPIMLAATAMLADPALPEIQRPTWEMVRDNIGLEARLIDDLLDVTRTISGKMTYDFETVDAHDLIDKAIEVVRGDALAKRIGMGRDLQASSSFVRADPARLTQAFWNVLKNAVKFTGDGGAVTVRTRNRDGGLVVEFQDEGIGIEPDALPKIFNAFEQVEDSVTRRYGGLGLGLAISKSVVEAHGGRIAASSAGRGRGATFSIDLATAAPAGRPEGAPPPEARGRRSCRLLLVEDDPTTCRIMALLLRNSGHDVTTAVDYESALGAASPSCDLVICDIGLPGRSGFDLMAELRRRHGLAGVALTGFGMEEDILKGREVGFVGHVTKPVDFPRLEAVIQRAADAARPIA